MALPPLTRQLVEQQLTAFCARRVPPQLHDQLRLSFTVSGNTVTLVEQRPYFLDATAEWTQSKIAVFVYDPTMATWELFRFDHNDHRMPYDAEPTTDPRRWWPRSRESDRYLLGMTYDG